MFKLFSVFFLFAFRTKEQKAEFHNFYRGALLVGSSLAHMGQDVGQLFALPLCTDVGAQSSLQELEGTLILGYLQQFHATAFVWSMTAHLTDQVANEFCVLRLHLEKRQKPIRLSG